MVSRLVSAFFRWCSSFWTSAGEQPLKPPSLEPRAAETVAQQLGDPSLPKTLLRGLRKAAWVDGSIVLGDAFWGTEKRANDDIETSITWEDTPAALTVTMTSSAAQFGAARLRAEDLLYEMKRENTGALVFAERTPTASNASHGDIVYRARCSKVVMKMIASALALESEYVARVR